MGINAGLSSLLLENLGGAAHLVLFGGSVLVACLFARTGQTGMPDAGPTAERVVRSLSFLAMVAAA